MAKRTAEQRKADRAAKQAAAVVNDAIASIATADEAAAVVTPQAADDAAHARLMSQFGGIGLHGKPLSWKACAYRALRFVVEREALTIAQLSAALRERYGKRAAAHAIGHQLPIERNLNGKRKQRRMIVNADGIVRVNDGTLVPSFARWIEPAADDAATVQLAVELAAELAADDAADQQALADDINGMV